MTDIENMLSGYIKPAEKADGDYTGKDGLLYCGKCHTPKETVVDLSDAGDGSELKRLRIRCSCENAEVSAEQDRLAGEIFRDVMQQRKSMFCISEPGCERCTFAADDSSTSKISVTCRRYVERWDKVEGEGIGILFYGSVGTGKSFYACAIANALLERRISAVVTNFPRLLNILQSARNKQEVIDHLQKYRLLVLDDLGVERDTTYAAEQVYSVIDSRARSGLPLIVTTNLTMEELKAPDTMQQQRIYDRILEMCPIPLKMTGNSRRSGNAASRRDTARDILGG